MTYAYKVATLNINGISSPTRLQMLEDLLYNHDIGIALLQEVTHPTIQMINRYTIRIKQGMEGRRAVTLVKEWLETMNTKRLPSGRGMAAVLKGTWIVNTGKGSTIRTSYISKRARNRHAPGR